MRLIRSKSLGRAVAALSVILTLCICNRRGDAFCPATQRTKLTPIPKSVHQLSPNLSKFQQRHQLLPSTRPLNTIPIYSSSVSPNADESTSDDGSPRSKLRQLTGFSLTALRSTLRAATGFSLTACRATLRAATGISLSETISGTMRRILGILTPGMRYFLQPFLIMYYAPLLMVRYWVVGPSQQYVVDSRKGHEKMVDGWRKAVEAAEKANAGGYWPVHLNGEFLNKHEAWILSCFLCACLLHLFYWKSERDESYLMIFSFVPNLTNLYYSIDDGTITTSLPPDPTDVLDLTDGIEQSVAAATTSATSETLSP